MTSRLLQRSIVCLLGAAACDSGREQTEPRDEAPAVASSEGAGALPGAPAGPEDPLGAPSASSSAAPHQSLPEGGAPASTLLPPAAPALPKSETLGCPEGMVWVHGEYCPVVIQTCVQHHNEYRENKADANVSERCLRYQKPSRCLSKQREQLSFCVDRFEYPNRIGDKPLVLTAWTEAKRLCETEGKRLCTEDEFNFACEGPEMLPYVSGYDRDATVCNIDRPYQRPDHSRAMLRYAACQDDARCRAEFERLDQRHAIGERLTCVSWAGVVDLNGNVNEWVYVPSGKPPRRSGLKGGWWGPVRNRCRPTVRFHKEDDYGYEAGFRCCSDRGAAGARRAPDLKMPAHGSHEP